MRTLKIICDCCQKEIEAESAFPLEHFMHVSPNFNRMKGHGKLIDGAMYATSGRKESRDFCLPCYNRLFAAFFDAMATIQKETAAETPPPVQPEPNSSRQVLRALLSRLNDEDSITMERSSLIGYLFDAQSWPSKRPYQVMGIINDWANRNNLVISQVFGNPKDVIMIKRK